MRINLNELYHYGVPGMKWGVRRYQNKDGTRTDLGKAHAREQRINKILDITPDAAKITNDIVRNAIESKTVLDVINNESQKRHLALGKDYIEGRSYLDCDLETAKKVYNKVRGTGEPILDSNGNWTNKERVILPVSVAVYVDPNTGEKSKPSKFARITYSKTGSHIMAQNIKKGGKK